MTVRLPAGAIVEVTSDMFGFDRGEIPTYVYKVRRRRVKFVSDLTLVELVPVGKGP
jgi:hypothetical protein